MARLTIGQKAGRVLGLLMGLGNPRAANALAAHGFTVADLEEGWQRLRAVSHARLGVRALARDPRIIDELDRFENTWFPIAGYTLSRHYPEANEFLFRNLSQTSGPEVAVSVQVFLERIRALVGGQTELGEAGMRVGEILGKRGLTPQVMADAQGLLDRLAAIQSEPAIPPPTPEEQEAAENALWSWYLEWGGIARIAIRDVRMLRSLGFHQIRRSSGEDEIVDEEEVTGAPVTTPPVTTPPVAPAPVAPTPEVSAA